MSTLIENLENIKKEIEESMELAQRTDQVLLVGVTKTFPVEVISEGINIGINNVGENKAQEFSGKYDIIRDKVNWHFIGHLQKNKVKYVVGKAKLIHSVDSFELAEEISKRSRKLDFVQDVLIEVNISGEQSKFGVNREDIVDMLHRISVLEGIRVRGLMTMAPNINDESKVREVFRGLRILKDEISSLNIGGIHMDYLSMGMSQDFKWAILEGANIIRVGSLLYGKR